MLFRSRFAQRFNLKPIFAHVVSIEDERIIHLFMMQVDDIKKNLDHVKHGYRIRFSDKYLADTIALPFVDYSVWRDELIGDKLFPHGK